jgi:hypothetical protein
MREEFQTRYAERHHAIPFVAKKLLNLSNASLAKLAFRTPFLRIHSIVGFAAAGSARLCATPSTYNLDHQAMMLVTFYEM